MQSGQSPRRRARLASFISLAVLCALAPAFTGALLTAQAALAADTPPGDGALSPRLAALASPSVRSVPPAKQAEALSLAAEGPGSLAREGNRVLVEVRFDRGAAAAVDDLRRAGAAVVNVSRRYQTVTVAAKPDELRALNGVPRVAGAEAVLQPIVASTCPSGAVVSEGVGQLHAGDGEFELEGGGFQDEARKAFGVDGAGVTVGVLSDSYNRATQLGGAPIATTASQDVGTGDLPGIGNTCAGQTTPVGVLDDSNTTGRDEGRAMAQIVHDVAPGATLAFATAFRGETAFAESIERLARPVAEGGAGAGVIVDDVSYFEEPFFQESRVAAAVSRVTAEGVDYLSAAGNNNLRNEGRDIASWEAPAYRDSGECPAAVVALSAEYREYEEQLEAEEPGLELPGIGLNASHCLDFDPGESSSDDTFGITVRDNAKLVVDLQWAEPWYGVGSDLDAFLLDESGDVLAESVDANEVSPYEALSWKNSSGSSQTVQLVVNRYAGGAPRVKFALLLNGGGVDSTEYEESSPGPEGDVVGPTIFGHNGGEDTISVGAINHSSTSAPEPFSSRGPVTHYFGPVDGTAPAAALEPTPPPLDKPDLTATDCGVTSFFVPTSTPSVFRFCGTSAAAPHAAGVAALMRQREPLAPPAEIRKALTDSAQPIEGFGANAVGAGLVDAVGALAALPAAEPEPEEETEGEEGEPEEEGEAGEEPEPEPEESSEPWEVIRTETTAPAPVPVTPDAESPTDSSPSPVGARSAGRPAPPQTFFRRRPPRLTPTRRRNARRAFLFGSDQPGVGFLCRLGRQRFHRCKARFVRRYSLGRHVLLVKARRSSDGVTDPTPAVLRFRVKRVRHGPLRRRHTRHHRRAG